MTSVDEDVGELEPSFIVCRTVKWHCCCEKTQIPYDPAILLLGKPQNN
jgi:hypothetical protein